jgi:hypothetical protein
MEITLVVPVTRNFAYDKDGIFFKERVFRRDNEGGAEYASSQIMYINDSIIMNGLTFLLNKNSSTTAISAISELERTMLKMYADTFVNINININNGTEHKKPNYLLTNDRLLLNLESESESESDITLYVTGIWENAAGFGLEYKWVKRFTRQ